MPANMILEAMIADLLYQATPRGGGGGLQGVRDRRASCAPGGLSSGAVPGRLNGGVYPVDAVGAYASAPGRIDRRASDASLKQLQLHHHQQQLSGHSQQQPAPLLMTPPATQAKDIAAAVAAAAAGSHPIGIKSAATAASPPSVSNVVAATASRYKTEMCRPYEETGHCRYGFKCQFAHGAHELRNLNRHPKYKTELCRTFHSTGFCSYGQRCNFIHNDDERLPSPPVAVTAAQQQLTAVSSPIDSLLVRGSRPRALSIAAMGSAGDSPASSISGDSPSSSPGYLADDVFGCAAGRVGVPPQRFFPPGSPAPPVSPIGHRRSFGGGRGGQQQPVAVAQFRALLFGGGAASGSSSSGRDSSASSLPDSGFPDDIAGPPSPAPSDEYPMASSVMTGAGCYCDIAPTTAFDLCGGDLHHSLFRQLTIGGSRELN